MTVTVPPKIQNPPAVPESLELLIRLGKIFMPYAAKQQQAVYENQTRFVHYTSAEAALSIIENKRLWMRNATGMSDYWEVRHGYQILDNFFSVENKKKAFVDAMDACASGAAMEAMSSFGQWRKNIQLGTYISSISEHDSKEDLHGRLSMWRRLWREWRPRRNRLENPVLLWGSECAWSHFQPRCIFNGGCGSRGAL